jgi:holo-[acyl-carrier protein] synthase
MSGVGCDILRISQIGEKIQNEVFFKKVFSEREILLFKERKFELQTIAGNFCAKEAFVKALGLGFGKIRPIDVEVLRKENGCPYILHKEKEYNVSISHDGEYAFAVVILS